MGATLQLPQFKFYSSLWWVSQDGRLFNKLQEKNHKKVYGPSASPCLCLAELPIFTCESSNLPYYCLWMRYNFTIFSSRSKHWQVCVWQKLLVIIQPGAVVLMTWMWPVRIKFTSLLTRIVQVPLFRPVLQRSDNTQDTARDWIDSSIPVAFPLDALTGQVHS